MSEPITTQPGLKQNHNTSDLDPNTSDLDPNSAITDSFLNVNKEPELSQFDGDEVNDVETKKKTKDNTRCCHCCYDVDGEFTLSFCECLAWFCNVVSECIQCGCIDCCQCLADTCAECTCDCSDCACDCSDCDGCEATDCGGCDCDCSD